MEREVLEQIIATSSSQQEDGLRVKIGETLKSVDSQNLIAFFSGIQICLKITCSLSHPAPPSTWPGSLATHQKAAATCSTEGLLVMRTSLITAGLVMLTTSLITGGLMIVTWSILSSHLTGLHSLARSTHESNASPIL